MHCPYCKTVQKDVIFWGFRKTQKRGKIQRFKCTRCEKSFVENHGFFHKHFPPETVLCVLSQYWKGLTSRELADEHGVTQKTVLSWLKEYTVLLYGFLCKLIQKLTKKLHLDELFLRMCGAFFYLWDAICSDSRFFFWFLSPKRDIPSCKKLLEQCPFSDVIVTDGYDVYPRAIREHYHGQASHEQLVSFEDKKNNNIAERLQNTYRRWLHPKRGFHSLKTGRIQLQGFWVYYNFIRTHTGIGCCPAEKAKLIEPWKVKTVKQRLQQLIYQATIFWLKILTPITIVLSNSPTANYSRAAFEGKSKIYIQGWRLNKTI